jgi:hypothetical protein
MRRLGRGDYEVMWEQHGSAMRQRSQALELFVDFRVRFVIPLLEV